MPRARPRRVKASIVSRLPGMGATGFTRHSYSTANRRIWPGSASVLSSEPTIFFQTLEISTSGKSTPASRPVLCHSRISDLSISLPTRPACSKSPLNPEAASACVKASAVSVAAAVPTSPDPETNSVPYTSNSTAFTEPSLFSFGSKLVGTGASGGQFLRMISSSGFMVGREP